MERPLSTIGISNLRRTELISGPYLQLIVQHEGMVRCLYETFAAAFPRMKSFWAGLAREEDQHYRLAELLAKDIQSTEIEFKRPAFTQSAIRDSIAWLCARKERVEAGGLAIREALAMCIQIERSMIEYRFFDVMNDDHEKVRDIFNQLQKSTSKHLARAEAEAGRFKWRILGGRKSKPVPAENRIDAPINTQHDPRLAIKAAQGSILAALIGVEESAASLYSVYAKLLPDYEGLWTAMAADERSHATMLHQLEDILRKGLLFKNMGQFALSSMTKVIEETTETEERAQRIGTTYNEAVIAALRLESYMEECEFYHTVESEAPEFKYIAERLVDHTKSHIRKLQEATGPMERRQPADKEEEREEPEWFG